jgi:dipeptidase D
MKHLQPRAVWSHFAALCAIPHPSLHEAALRDHLVRWAGGRGIETIVDPVGNLILRKPASPGYTSRPGVVLQGHLDMVSQANAGTVHDFERDPIRAVVRDGWVVADATTLGADNGIGVALALAALEEPGLVHPAIEVLLTVNEETGMDGARGLAPGSLLGRTLINLDTEEWEHFYLGCAGGVDVEVRQTVQSADLAPGYATRRLEVAGLRGGHSGIDIASGRGNAIKLLVEALRDLAGRLDLHLVGLQGGSARNAIPREAVATLALPADRVAELDGWARQRLADWRQRLAAADPGLSLGWVAAAAPARRAVARIDRDRVLGYLDSAANGVARMSDAFPGVVETSDNLGMARLDESDFSATFKVRSLVDADADALADRLVAHAAGQGLRAWKDGAYPGWRPNPASELVALCRRVYADQFGRPPSLQVIHAGLECGLLAASHPHLDMISFGPDIRGAHAPGERVEIASVERCWHLLKAVLRDLAIAEPVTSGPARAAA